MRNNSLKEIQRIDVVNKGTNEESKKKISVFTKYVEKLWEQDKHKHDESLAHTTIQSRFILLVNPLCTDESVGTVSKSFRKTPANKGGPQQRWISITNEKLLPSENLRESISSFIRNRKKEEKFIQIQKL